LGIINLAALVVVMIFRFDAHVADVVLY